MMSNTKKRRVTYMAEKMLVTQALDERDLLVDKITDLVMNEMYNKKKV